MYHFDFWTCFGKNFSPGLCNKARFPGKMFTTGIYQENKTADYVIKIVSKSKDFFHALIRFSL